MQLLPKSPKTLRVTPDILEEMRLSSGNGQLFEIKPYLDSPQTIEDNIEMFKAFHQTKYTGWLLSRNKSPTNGFEIWFDGENVRFMMYIGERNETKRAIRHVASNFPSASIELPDESAGTAFPHIEEEEYVAAADFRLRMHMYAPIRNPRGIEQWTEPYRNIIADMTDEREVREVVQILFKPVNPGWTSSFFNDVSSFADEWAAERTVETLGGLEQDESPAAEEALKAQSDIKSQLDQQGFYINIRVLTISKSEKAAEEQCKEISRSVRDYYREWTSQHPVPIYKTGYDIQRQLYDMISRKGTHMHWPYNPMTWRKRKRTGTYETLIMTIPELAGLAHIPNGSSLNTEAVDWERLDSSNSLPANAPKYRDYQTPPEDGDEDTDEEDSPTDVENDGDDPTDFPESEPKTQAPLTEPPANHSRVDNPELDSGTETTTPELDSGTEPELEADTTSTPELPSTPDSSTEPDDTTADEPPISSEDPKSNTDFIKSNDEIWTKPEPGDPDYNPAKDNQNYRTGYNEEDGAGDWTGGLAREDDLNGDFDKYEPPGQKDTSTDHTEGSESDTETESATTTDQSDLEPWERGAPSSAVSEEDETTEDEFDDLNKAAVEGMMENEGKPPEFKDKRKNGTKPSSSLPEDEKTEIDPDGASNDSPEDSEEDTSTVEETETVDDEEEPTTDEAKGASHAQLRNIPWETWDEVLERQDSPDDSEEDQADEEQ